MIREEEHVNVQEESHMAILDSRFYSESYLLMSTCGLICILNKYSFLRTSLMFMIDEIDN